MSHSVVSGNVFALYPTDGGAPDEWARLRENQGWDGVAVSDHLLVDERAAAHVWVTATAMACATSSIKIATSFCNNLMRSPVEFAQASLTLQRLCGGRFVAGLGAGWDSRELEACGMEYPSTAVRAGRYIESVRVIRQLFDTGQAEFAGRWLTVSVPSMTPSGDFGPPPLAVAVSGPRVTREIAPLADIVEVTMPGFASNGRSSFDIRTAREFTFEDLRTRVATIRDLNPRAVISFFVLCGCGPDHRVDRVREALSGAWCGQLFGEPSRVCEALANIRASGVDRLTVAGLTASTHHAISAHLRLARN